MSRKQLERTKEGNKEEEKYVKCVLRALFQVQC